MLRVAIIGLPNSGKSTLLNALVGEKLAAVSQTPQTTRGRILGVVNRGDVQLAFLDTPGIHQAKHVLNQRMLKHVETALVEADLLLWVVDADGFLGPGERDLAKRLKHARQPVYLLLNKIDLLSKGRLLEKIAAYKDLLPFKEIIPVGAKLGLNLDPLWADPGAGRTRRDGTSRRTPSRTRPSGAWPRSSSARRCSGRPGRKFPTAWR